MVVDKNGTELKIGDTVHVKTEAKTFEFLGRVRTRPSRDYKFVITEFGVPNIPNSEDLWVWGPGANYLPRHEAHIDPNFKNWTNPAVIVKVDKGGLTQKSTKRFKFV